MPSLSELTDPQAVLDTIARFRTLGRDQFLSEHGFDRSRDYFVREGGELFDSKPLLAVAYAVQYPDRGILDVKGFSGGTGGAVRALNRLGFEVVTRAQLSPPRRGDTYGSRTDIYETYGGDKVAGIIRFPGDMVVNIFSDTNGPYADDPPTLTQPFEYRGEGLNGPQRLVGGNALLEASRSGREPARFWYRPSREPFMFLTWVVVLGRSWVAGTGQDGVPRPEIAWQLEAVPEPDSSAWAPDVVQTLDDVEAVDLGGPEAPESRPGATYGQLVARVEHFGQPRRPSGVVRVNFPRSAAARRAVLVRSGGSCESERCTGMPAELNRRGEPILDVDHIEDLARGGEDHPRNMVALCPNCHAAKTRGANTARWRRELLGVARRAHAASLLSPGE